MANFVINADSRPVYDAFGTGDYWGCEEWIKWHKALLSKYKTDEADYIWSSAWLDGVSKAGGGKGTAEGSGYVFDSVPIDCRTFNPVFRDYIKTRPNLYSAVYSGIGGLIAKPLGLGADIVEGAGNLVSGANTTTKVLRVAVPALFIALSIGLVWYGYKKFIKPA